MVRKLVQCVRLRGVVSVCLVFFALQVFAANYTPSVVLTFEWKQIFKSQFASALEWSDPTTVTISRSGGAFATDPASPTLSVNNVILRPPQLLGRTHQDCRLGAVVRVPFLFLGNLKGDDLNFTVEHNPSLQELSALGIYHGTQRSAGVEKDAVGSYQEILCHTNQGVFKLEQLSADATELGKYIKISLKALEPGEETVFPFDSSAPPRSAQYGNVLGRYKWSTRDELRVTLASCPAEPGTSGDGTVIFQSKPPVDVKPWPFVVNEEKTIREISQMSGKPGKIIGLVHVGDFTIRPTWGEYVQGKGKCIYLDQLDLEFPPVQLFIAKEFAKTEQRETECWYYNIRDHEMRHILYHEEAFRTIQRRILGLLNDPSTATPAHPQYGKVDALGEDRAETIKQVFLTRVGLIIDEEVQKANQNQDSMDSKENYDYEHCLCKFPDPVFPGQLITPPGCAQ